MADRDPLSRYRQKRDFARTPEPRAEGEARGEGMSFVVQKHWASSLHYDFRLELGGAMKSWAVPKGPSLDPHDKRMAVHVEDHPVSYNRFEGTIPAGQYGAGKVIVWDTGRWQPLGDAERGYREGNLKFDLHGHKLQGRWVLVRMNGKGERQEPWLLIKEKDVHARPAAEFNVVDELPDSVSAKVSKRTTGVEPSKRLKPSPRAALPREFSPQLATLVDAPPPDPAAWVFEVKFDGYRMLARVDSKGIALFTRNGNDWTDRLAPLATALARMKLPPGWYDGEIVMPDERGVPDFGALQAAFDAGKTSDIVYYLFDLLYCDGRDLRALPLQARRAALAELLASRPAAHVQFSTEFSGDAHSMVASACKLGLEGVLGKRRDAPYTSGRSRDWIKLKCSQRQEFVIGGFTDPQGSRAGFGALVLGVHDAQGVLQPAGNVGTGFTARTLADIRRKLDALRRKTSPFAPAARVEGRPHWVEPRLVAEVSFGEWTRDGHIRHAVFHGLRDDKPVSEIVRERAQRGAKAAGKAEAGAASASQALSQRLRVTHPERVVDAASGITKIELVRYYGLVGELMMTHLKDRPVALVRATGGVGGELFFQKHAETEKLTGVRQLDRALYPVHPPMLAIASRQGLLSCAQWNVVEFHTQNAVASAFDRPDRMVFDIDPGDGVAWKQVQEGAELVGSFLTQLGLKPFLKTSGGKGLHVVVPIRKLHDWDTVKGFSQAIVQHLARTIPQRFVARSGPRNRVGRIFVDYLRNGLGATTACAWSARARPGIGISVPVDWDELGLLTSGAHWTVRTAHTRLDRGNEPWAGYARSARSITAAVKALNHPEADASAIDRK